MKLRLTDKRNIKSRNKVVETVIEPLRRFCICRSTEDKGFMIWCEVCFDWFHGACVNLTPDQAKGLAHYTCPQCLEKQSSSQNDENDDKQSGSLPIKKGKRKPATKPKANSRTYNAEDMPDYSNETTPPLKRTRTLPKISAASPQVINPSNQLSGLSSLQGPIRARTKVQVVQDSFTSLLVSPPHSNVDNSPSGLSQVAVTPQTPRQYDLEQPTKPNYMDMLNDDCLLSICKMGGEQSIRSLIAFMGVCKRWRNVALSQSAWDTISICWRHFCLQIQSFVAASQITKQLLHVRKIQFWDDGIGSTTILSFKIRTVAWAFPKLKEVMFESMYMEHVAAFICAFPNLEVISCIRLEKPPYFEMSFIIFAEHTRLRKLYLHFSDPCEHSGYGYMMNKRGHWLPSSLETLSIVNLYDPEEHDITGRDWWHIRTDNDFNRLVARWNSMEEALIVKYAFFNRMPNLRNLTLGRCNSWTARIWMECFLPCCEQLEYLHLIGWDGDGYRESPGSWRERHAAETDSTYMVDTNDDTERAIKHCISHMKNLRRLRLEQFKVPTGLIDMVHKLPRMESFTVSDA